MGAKLGEVGHQHDGPRIPSPLRPPTTLDACCCERFVAVFAIPMFIKRLRLRPLIRRAEQDFLQVFCKRFSGHERAQVSDRQGADARRDAIPGQFVCVRCPGAGALDQVNQVRILEGQLTAELTARDPLKATQGVVMIGRAEYRPPNKEYLEMLRDLALEASGPTCFPGTTGAGPISGSIVRAPRG